MAERELKLKIIVDDSGAVVALDGVERKLHTTEEAGTALGKTFGDATSLAKGMGTSLADATTKVGAAATHAAHATESLISQYEQIFSGAATKSMHGLGTGILEDANAVTEAVGRIGGAARLTEAEQVKVNKQVTEAISKYKAMGQQAPDAMVALQRATSGAADATSGFKQLLARFGPALMSAFSIGAIIQFARSVIQSASALQDLHDKTGISTDALQRFKMAADLSGSSIEAVTMAVVQMGKRLAGGENDAVQAVQSLGLSVSDLIAMGPERAFHEIALKIAEIPDPMRQADVAMSVFGVRGAELIPTFKQIAKGGDDVVLMSKGTIEALDLLGDSYTRLVNNAAPLFFQWAQNYTLIGKVTTFILDQTDAMRGYLPIVAGHVEAAKRWNEQARATNLVVPVGSEAIRIAALASADLKREYQDIVLPATKLREEKKKLNDEVVRMAREMPLAKVAVFEWGSDAQYAWEQANKLALYLYEVNEQFILMIPLAETTEERFRRLAQEGDGVVRSTSAMKLDLSDLAGAFAQLAQVAGDSFAGIVQDIGTMITAINLADQAAAQYAKGGLSNMISGLVSGAAAMGQATSSSNALVAGLGGAMTGMQIGGEIAGPFGAAIGAVAGAVLGLGRALFGVSEEERKARKAIEDFEQSLRDMATAAQLAEAGTDDWKVSVIVLRDAYMAMGQSETDALAAAERLWASSRSGTQAAQAAIEEISQVLADYMAQQQAITEATDRLRDATERYEFTIEELGPAMRAQELHEMSEQLYTDWQLLTASGIDIDTVAQRMSASVQEYLAIALATGAEVPIAMRPMIERMIDMGLLTDANGQALTDMSAIPWAETMSQGFDRVVEAVDRMIVALGYGVPTAADAATDAIRNIPTDLPINVYWDVEDFPDIETSAAHRGGTITPYGVEEYHGGGPVMPWIRAHRGLAMDEVPIIAQAGEGVLSRRGMRALGALNRGASVGGAVTINVDAKGAVFEDDRAIDKLALKISAAMGRRYAMSAGVPGF